MSRAHFGWNRGFNSKNVRAWGATRGGEGS